MHPNNPAIDPIGRHQTGAGDNPFDHPDGLATGFLNAVLATALFRCWHLALLFTLWATAISLISDKVRPLTVQPTLLTVFGTSLGFVISYRTSSAFERYNEGRRYWSSILYCSRTLARVIWFHVPDSPADPDHPEQNPARMLIERKSAINLIEAFAVAVKHYLRGEEGIDYPDLYELVCFLPVYSLPAGRPQTVNMDNTTSRGDGTPGPITRSETFRSQFSRGFPGLSSNQSRPKDPQPESQATSNKASVTPVGTIRGDSDIEKGEFPKPKSAPTFSTVRKRTSMVTGRSKVGFYPITLLKRLSVKHAKGEEETRRTREAENHNIPLEITFYLSSYIVELQRRKILDVPTLTNLLLNLNALVDALTGLERILTTPIPFSYTTHLWMVTAMFLTVLPFQLWSAFRYLTIPATALATIVFFGFLVAGEEIENPFGYDKNDLNLDHFTNKIIREELNAITSRPPPCIADWIFSTENTEIFAGNDNGERGVTPQQWIARGEPAIRKALRS